MTPTFLAAFIVLGTMMMFEGYRNGILRVYIMLNVSTIYRQLGNVVDQCIRVLQASMRPSGQYFLTPTVAIRKHRAADGRKAMSAKRGPVTLIASGRDVNNR
jgi:hypothetical protein